MRDEEVKRLKQKVGDFVLDLDIYKDGMRGHPFGCFSELRRAIANWIEWYNTGRPHQALGYVTPKQLHAQ